MWGNKDEAAIIERLGNETIARIELPSGDSWLVELDSDTELKLDESLSVNFPPESGILFDANGKSLSSTA